MPRQARAFKAEACELEGRLLMASDPPNYAVQFVGLPGIAYAYGDPIQIVTQQAGTATVTLSRSVTTDALQVEVATDPSTGSALQGGNVGAVDQTVTFAPGQSQATVTVPIIAGAPNPGEVDAYLYIKSVDGADPPPADPPSTFPLDLKIVASDPTLPPKVVSKLGFSQAIVLSFNKPMDPVGASNVNNYSVYTVNPWTTYTGFLKYPKSELIVKHVQFESAQYDPATQTVTLIPKHPILYISSTWSQLKRTTRSVRTAHSSNVAPGLTDLQGNPINADTTPGKVEYRLVNHPMSFGGSL
jgi:hypothetical protein